MLKDEIKKNYIYKKRKEKCCIDVFANNIDVCGYSWVEFGSIIVSNLTFDYLQIVDLTHSIFFGD